jgi:hypothetical protein
MGFEPMTSRMPCERSSQLSYSPIVYVQSEELPRSGDFRANHVGKLAFNHTMSETINGDTVATPNDNTLAAARHSPRTK